MAIGSVPSLIVGVGAGAAASAAFEPALERPKQDAWKAAPNRLPDVGLIASLVAGGKVSLQDGHNMAARLGFDQGPFDSLVWLAQNRLEFPLMLRLWRRFPNYVSPSGKTIDALLDETLAHEQLDWNYHDLLKQLQTSELPGIGDIAYAVVRGYLPTNINLPVAPPTTSTNVKRFPQSTVLAEHYAARIGYDQDILELMIARSGLSMAPGLAAQAFFRGILADDDYQLAIAEGDLRTEWGHALREASRAIPTPSEYAEAWLRGYRTQQEAEDGAALHGMSADHLDLIHLNKGRPPALHQVTTGLARGGTYPAQYTDVPQPYRDAIRESDVKEPWADVAFHNRYTYPSAFVLRTLAQAGDLGGQQAVEQVLLEIGWKPSFATQVSTAWTGGAKSGDPHEAKAQTQLWTTTHKSYVAEEITDATATAALVAAGVAAAAIPAILALWAQERALVRKQLSPTQIRKAVNLGIVNPATGQPWTVQNGIDALLARGYDHADATVFLEE